tara:strand:+ start:155 stop:316 length:162 start_codon:yes stop_codon:yes gene_type:complete
MSAAKKRFVSKYPSLKFDPEEFKEKYDHPEATDTESSEGAHHKASDSEGEDNI